MSACFYCPAAAAVPFSGPCNTTSVHEGMALTSPPGRPSGLGLLARDCRKKQSPVATVLPQVQLREQQLPTIKKGKLISLPLCSM